MRRSSESHVRAGGKRPQTARRWVGGHRVLARATATVARTGLRLALLTALVCACSAWQVSAPMASIKRRHTGTAGLAAVYRNALSGNADYRAALAGYRAAIEAAPQARSALLPRLSASAGYGEVYQSVKGEIFDTNQIDRDDDFQRQRYGITLAQPLFDRGALIGLEQADVALEQARLELTQARNTLAINVAHAYFSLLDARNRLIFVRAEKKAIHRQLDQVDNRLQAGLTSDADLKSAQAQLDIAAADEISVQNDLEIARNRLEGLTGHDYRRIRGLPADAPLPPVTPGRPQPWIDAALEYNTALRSARASTRLAALGTRRAQAARWPQLDLVGSYAYVDQNGGFYDSEGGIGGANNNEDAQIGVRLSMPIFSGGIVSSRVRQAAATHEARQAQQTQQRIDTVGDTRTAFLNIRKDRARVQALDKAIDSAEAAVHAARVGFDVGNTTSADVLKAVRDEFRARRDFALARSQYLLDLLELKRLTGQLDQPVLAKIDRRLQ